MADKLRELKKLLDDGLITQEEYEAMRKKILEEFTRK
ncbi:MAG: SHOCT domain-containing protein [Desulfurococcaceae archaeon]